MTSRFVKQDESGFTLVEMLVAIGILSLMLTYAYSALHGFQHIRRVEQRLEHQRPIEAARRHFRHTIANVKIVFGQQENGETKLVFEGRPHELTLVSSLDDRLVRGGLHLLRYHLHQEESRIVLDYSVRRAAPSTAITEPVLDGAEDFSFRYFGAQTAGVAPTWTDTWVRRDALPNLVEINLKLSPALEIAWEPLLIQLEASR